MLQSKQMHNFHNNILTPKADFHIGIMSVNVIVRLDTDRRTTHFLPRFIAFEILPQLSSQWHASVWRHMQEEGSSNYSHFVFELFSVGAIVKGKKAALLLFYEIEALWLIPTWHVWNKQHLCIDRQHFIPIYSFMTKLIKIDTIIYFSSLVAQYKFGFSFHMMWYMKKMDIMFMK